MEDRGLEPLQNPREFDPFSQSGTKSGTIGAWLASCPIEDADLKKAIEVAVMAFMTEDTANALKPPKPAKTTRKTSNQSNRS